jgi:predicted DNA-binding protein with PD1-like motif
MKYKRENNVIFVRLHETDKVVESLEEIAQQENIITCTVQGIGAVTNAKLGMNKYKLKKYDTITLEGDYELTSLNGNVTMQNGKAIAHLHATLNNDTYVTFGGHLFNAEVTATAEIVLTIFETDVTEMFKR